MSTEKKTVSLDAIVSLCKRRGFVYQTADIYGGLNGVYDFGHLGVLLKKNIRNAWKKSIKKNGPIVMLDGALLGPQSVWEASGHVENFHDPMVDCLQCKKRFRADEINLEKGCPSCGNKNWTDIKQFNMMFKTALGASSESTSVAYLRPETAQSIFVNFKNILTTSRVKIPFGIAQIGKAFRNEITPKQFLFRMREFEQMEVEWFCKESDAQSALDSWKNLRFDFYLQLGINKEKIRLRNHGSNELAHYSTACVDIEYQFPFGWKELEGIAHRGNFDLTQHSQHSGKELSVYDDETKKSYIPHVVESSVGVDRLFLTFLFDAYQEDIIEDETRTVLKLAPTIAPIKAAFLPLTKKQLEKTKEIFNTIQEKTGFELQLDVSGSIGKRYRRQDEIGTPFCFTYDFDSDQDGCVTVRDRDTTKQKRIAIEQIESYLKERIK